MAMVSKGRDMGRESMYLRNRNKVIDVKRKIVSLATTLIQMCGISTISDSLILFWTTGGYPIMHFN